MLLLFVGAFTWLTFSLSRADEHEDDMAPGDTVVSTVKTNIDLIIQNSNDTEKEDSFRQYHIVEISSGTPASFKGFCEKASDNTTQFELLVLNEHRTKQTLNEANQIIDTAVFCPGYIDYKSFNLESLRAAASNSSEITANFQPVLEAVVNADLIYVSCDTTDNGAHVFSADSDFTTELLSTLSLYVTNDLKPIIIDSPTKVADDLFGTSKTFQYIGAAFGESGSARNTFAWQFDNVKSKLDPENAMSYFTRTMPSKYLPISGRDVEADKWTDVTYEGKNYKAAKILTVKANGGNNPITDQVKDGLGTVVDVTVAGTTDTLKAQRLYAGIDVEEEELIEEDPDDTYDIYNPIASESGNKASLTITAAFTGNDDAAYNPTASAKLHILDYKRDEYKSDIDVSDGTKLSYDAGSHAYVIDFTKDNSSITLENIPVECIYYIETTNDDITDPDTYDAEANKAYLPYRVLETGSNTADLQYIYKADCGSIEYGVLYDNNVLEPGARYFYFALFKDANGEFRCEEYDVREARLGNGINDFVNLEWDGVPYGTYFVLETDSTGNVLDGGRLPSSSSQTIDAAHKIVASSLQKNGNTFASKVKIDYTIADLKVTADMVPNFQFAIRLRDEKGKLVTGTFPAVLSDGTTNTNVTVEFKNGMAVSTIGGKEVEAIEIPYQKSLTITIPDQYRYRISEISPLKIFKETDPHYRYNSGNFNDYITAAGNATYTFENDYVESYGSALFYAYKIYEQHPDFIVSDVLEYNAADDTKNFSNINLEDYDLIIFEGNLQSLPLATGKNGQPNDYNKLKSYMKNKTVNGYYNHIIYASNICPENSSIQGYTFDGAVNFMTFYNSLMIKTDVPNGAYSVLLTSPSEMKSNLVDNVSADSVNDIAELINKARYRFTGGKADVTNHYRVLEIQPCYPIDLNLAAFLTRNKENDDSVWVAGERVTNASGYYYLDYDEIWKTSKYTKDEISFDNGATAVSDYATFSNDTRTITVEEEYEEGLGTYHTELVRQPNQQYNAGTVLHIPNGVNHYNDTQIGTYDGGIIVRITQNGTWIDGACIEEQVEDTVTKTRSVEKKVSGLNAGWDITDYYDWEVSPAKILHILKQSDAYSNFTIDDIEVVHMSTEEFVCSRESILDNYDMIYIGGNNSAIKDLNYFMANPNNVKISNYLGMSNATYYNMYYHNGDVFRYNTNNIKGYVNNAYGVQIGNDLTLKKYEELINYANNDMPIIISKPLADAFDSSNGSYTKHQIDPDSRMYALLSAIKTKGNVGWGVDTITTQKIDIGDLNGVSYAPNGHRIYSNGVTFFNSTAEGTIKNLINNHGSRPKYQITYHYPYDYKIEDPSTTSDTRDISIEFTIPNVDELMKKGHKFTAYLYLDDNGDSRFDIDKEEVDSKPGQLGKLEHTVPDDFFGACYLQVTIADEYTGTDGKKYEQRSSQRFLCKIDPPSEDKDRINILQVLPKGAQKAKTLKYGDAGTGYDTLFFCTECQLVGGILEAGTNANGASALKNDSVFKRDGSGKYEPAVNAFTDSNALGNGAAGIKSKIENYEHRRTDGDPNYTLYVNAFGVHEHTFGIPIYKKIGDAPEWAAALNGNYEGLDDYNSNFANYIADDYDFNMEIIETDEFSSMVGKIQGKYTGKSATEIQNLKTKYSDSSATFEKYYNILDTLMEKCEKEYQAYNSTGAASDEFFTYMQDEFGFSRADMHDFEEIMKDLGASVDDIKRFTGSKKGIVDYINNTVMPKTASQTQVFATNSELIKTYLEQILTTERYADYFSLCNYTDRNGSTWEYTLTDYTALFIKWRDASIYRKYFLNMYMQDAKYAAVNDAGVVDLTSLYSIIILGPADDFNNQDMDERSIDALKTYINNDGRVLLFYDTITINNAETGKPNAELLTKELRDTFGQDARPESELVVGGTAANEYYISKLASSGTSNLPNTNRPFVDEAITNRSMLYKHDKGAKNDYYMNSLMYKYASYIFYPENENNKYQAYHQIGKEQLKNSITDRASRNNVGILTMYPFALGENLNITSTNPQAFNLDLEDEDMTVYYTLAGGTGALKAADGKQYPQSTNSSLFAATPNDGGDNYFIYQYKNVTYCGAGNTVVTGLGTDNNDERKLFINVIVNSLRKSAIGTQVKLYDPLKTDPNTGNVTNPMSNAKLRPTGTGVYELEAKSMNDSPEFSFYIKTDKNVTISRVTAYYDLDLLGSNGEAIALDKSHAYDTDTFADAATNVKHQDSSGNALREHVLIYDTGVSLANLRAEDKDLNKKQRNVNLGIVKDITKNTDGTYSSYNAGLQGVTYGESSNGSYYAAGCNLDLKEDYFKPYDGAFTYITVRVETKDSKGRDLAPIYRRIKVVLPYDLFDLN